MASLALDCSLEEHIWYQNRGDINCKEVVAIHREENK